MARYEKLISKYSQHAKLTRQSTEIDIFETPQQKADRKKDLESGYGKWFMYHFPRYAKSPMAWFHIWLANLIINNTVCYVAINWYRGSAKSVHACMGIPLYLALVKKDLHFMLLVGQTEKKARRLLSDIQVQLKFNRRIINDYGEQFQHGDWADGEFTTKDGIKFMALGIGQDPRGAREGSERPDYIACSDVDSKQRCKNPSRVKEGVEWIMEDLWGCYDSADGATERYIHDNNRISKTSICHQIIEQFKHAAKASEAEELPVIHHVSRVIAHDRNFNPSWPDRAPKAYWERKFKRHPNRISYHREYLDDPIEEGKLFKNENIIWGQILPLEEYDALAIYGDLSYKDEGDFKALRFWGKKGREKHLIACYVRQSSRRAAAEWLYNYYEDLGNQSNHLNITCKIEGLFAQDEFINDFDMEGDDREWYIAVTADKRGKENKYNRIEGTTGLYEKHWIIWNKEEQDNPDFIEGKRQILGFEKGSSIPDDAPDADHGAFDLLDRLAFVEKFEPRIKRRKTKVESKDW